MARDSSGGGGCGRVFMIGCAGVLIVIALAALLLVLNFGRIRGAFDSARATFGEAIEIQQQIQARYAAEHVGVNIRRTPAVEGTVFSITLVNPSFLAEETADPEPAAREVARLAKSLLGSPGDYAQIEVVLKRIVRHGVVTKEQTSSFAFPIDELEDLAAEPEPEPEPVAARTARYGLRGVPGLAGTAVAARGPWRPPVPADPLWGGEGFGPWRPAALQRA
jgi:hypothetical protein